MFNRDYKSFGRYFQQAAINFQAYLLSSVCSLPRLINPVTPSLLPTLHQHLLHDFRQSFHFAFFSPSKLLSPV
jgi:hypothetical protein